VFAAILRVVELVEGMARSATDGAGPRCGKAD
jgi:hypothetical protein